MYLISFYNRKSEMSHNTLWIEAKRRLTRETFEPDINGRSSIERWFVV